MSDDEQERQRALARQRKARQRQRQRADGLVDVLVTVPADKADDVKAFAAQLRGDDA